MQEAEVLLRPANCPCITALVSLKRKFLEPNTELSVVCNIAAKLPLSMHDLVDKEYT